MEKDKTLQESAPENKITKIGEKEPFIITSILPTSITINVGYPLDIGIWGNRLLYYDETSRLWKTISGVDYYMRSGSYTLYGLTAGIKYKFFYNYFDYLEKSWGEGKYIDIQTPMPQENLITYSRSNIDFELDKTFTDTLGNGLTNRFLDDINQGFASMYNLVNGDVTYKGEE
ncbi:MAG: hypothetical protein LBU94_01230 [Clostridiales bacterium]|jgi:hypothetical protein|nr:hypothetical protein [Clostridiales bacterium]